MRRLLFAAAVTVAWTAIPAVTRAQPADWGATRDPFDKNVVTRYKAILARTPHDASALAKLLEMYRRYRTVDLLKDEYQKQLDKKADDWAALVVLGRLMHATGDDQRARDLWAKAVGVKDDDAEGWIGIGEADKPGAGHATDARADYDNALAHASSKDMKKKALRALADLALATGDNDGANAYFKQFLDLDPTNAQLWIERGDAMLAAGKREVALESYAAAEKLLGSDPPRRVEVVARRGRGAREGLGKDDDAVVEYKRAIKLAPKSYYLEVEAHRPHHRHLPRASRRCRSCSSSTAEKAWPDGMRGHFEVGHARQALRRDRRAGQGDRRAQAGGRAGAVRGSETQRRLIQLLENSGAR